MSLRFLPVDRTVCDGFLIFQSKNTSKDHKTITRLFPNIADAAIHYLQLRHAVQLFKQQRTQHRRGFKEHQTHRRRTMEHLCSEGFFPCVLDLICSRTFEECLWSRE